MNFTRFLDGYENTSAQSYTFSMESGSFNTSGVDLIKAPQSYSFPLEPATFGVVGADLNSAPQSYTFNLESGTVVVGGVEANIGSVVTSEDTGSSSSLIKDFSQKLSAAFPEVVVRPVFNKEPGVPSITYSVRGGQRDTFYTGSFGLARTEVTLDVYTKRYSDLRTVLDTLENEFHGFTGMVGQTYVFNSYIGDYFESYEDDPEQLYRGIITITLIT